MKIINRYASAVHSSNLKSRAETHMSDTDVLGAFGIADRRLSKGLDECGEEVRSKHPLAVPLQRLFSGDRSSAGEIVRILAKIIRGKALKLRIEMAQTQADDMAKVILGWFQSPRCKVCGGHGVKIIKGTKTLGDNKCRPCDGTGKVQLERLYPYELRELVRFAIARMELEAGLAGPAAMKAIAPKLDL